MFILEKSKQPQVNRKDIVKYANELLSEFHNSSNHMDLKAIQKWLWLANYAKRNKKYYHMKTEFPKDAKVKSGIIKIKLENKNDDSEN